MLLEEGSASELPTYNKLQPQGSKAKGALKLSLEALAVDKRFTPLFTDEEANEALMRLLDAGYRF